MSDDKWSEDDGSADPALSRLVREAIGGITSPASLDDRILVHARAEMQAAEAPVADASNDPVFAPVRLELLAAADGAERTFTSFKHAVGEVVYGEIQIEQFENSEVDLVYELTPELVERYLGCSVRLDISDHSFVIGPLDPAGRAALTVTLDEIPVSLHCALVRPEAD
jgi:hypothetical protein